MTFKKVPGSHSVEYSREERMVRLTLSPGAARRLASKARGFGWHATSKNLEAAVDAVEQTTAGDLKPGGKFEYASGLSASPPYTVVVPQHVEPGKVAFVAADHCIYLCGESTLVRRLD